MIKKQRHIIILLCTVTSLYSQDSVEKIFNRFSSQSFVKQNTYLLNPTFTVVNETGKSIVKTLEPVLEFTDKQLEFLQTLVLLLTMLTE